MALYRCAACGSRNVVTDTQAGGVEYNYLKGAVGTVVLGAGGAAAGIGSKQQRVFKCPDCGISLTYAMMEELKNAIDLGVISADARENLTLWNTPVTWDYLKGKYKNIEEGAGDAVLKMRAEHQAEIAKIQSEINRDVAERVIKRMQAIDVELAIDENSTDNTDELQQLWTKDSEAIISAREKSYQEGLINLNTVFQEKIVALETESNEMESALAEKKAALGAEQDTLSEKLPTLGVFKLGEKQKVKKRLEEIAVLLSDLAVEQEKSTKDSKKKIDDVQQEKEKEIEELKEKTAQDFPLTESPYEKKEWLNQIREAREKRKASSMTSTQRYNEEIKELLLLIMKEYDRRMCFSYDFEDSDINSVIEICSMISDKYQGITDQRLHALVSRLKNEGKIIETTEKRRSYYHLA